MRLGSKVLFQNFFIEPSGELDKLSEVEKESISDDLIDFLERFKTKFREAHLHLNLKEHKETRRGVPSVYSIVNLTTDKGRFHSSAKGWGAQQSVSTALEQLRFQIERKFNKFGNRKHIHALFRKQAIV